MRRTGRRMAWPVSGLRVLRILHSVGRPFGRARIGSLGMCRLARLGRLGRLGRLTGGAVERGQGKEQRRGKKAESVERSADRVRVGCGSRAESRGRGRRKGMEGDGTGRGAKEEEEEEEGQKGEGEAVLTLGYAWILCSDGVERVGGWTGQLNGCGAEGREDQPAVVGWSDERVVCYGAGWRYFTLCVLQKGQKVEDLEELVTVEEVGLGRVESSEWWV